MRSNDHGDAPNLPREDPKSMVARNMIFDDFGGAKGILDAKRRQQTHHEIVRTLYRKNARVDVKSYQKDANIGAKYNNR